MKSVKLSLREAIEAIERERLTSDEVIRCDTCMHTSTNIQLTDEAFIRLYHQLRIARSALNAEAVDGYLHMSFYYRRTHRVVFCACIKLEKAAQFIDSKQQALPAPKAKRVAGGGQKRLAFAGGGDS